MFWLEDGDAPQPPKLRGRLGKTAKSHPVCAEPQTAWAVLRHLGAAVRVEQPKPTWC